VFTLSTPAEGRSYHHRDLPRALVRSALEILSEAGVAGLSLRAAARRAKVSAMAPYRHFADKEALLAAVAEYGFRQLTARFTAAVAGAPDPRPGPAALGVAYVLFAREIGTSGVGQSRPVLFRRLTPGRRGCGVF